MAPPTARPGVVQRRPPSVLADLLIAAVVVVPALITPLGDPSALGEPLSILLVVGPVTLLMFRRRWPVVALAGCVAAFGITAWLGNTEPWVVISMAIAGFSMANRTSRRTALVVGGAAVVVITALSVLLTRGQPFDVRILSLVFVVATGLAAGDATRSRRELLREVTERALRAEETRESEAQARVAQERLRIARDLHDRVAHEIAVISLNAGVASSALTARPDLAERSLGEIRRAARSVLGEIGDVLRLLRSDEPVAGLEAPRPGLEKLDELLHRVKGAGLRVTVRSDDPLPKLVGTADEVAYRTVQEGLTNAHKHGADQRAHLLLAHADDRLKIVVSNPVADDVDRESAPSGSGYGLLGLRERVAAVDGTMTTGSTPAGFQLTVTLPLPKEQV